MRKSSVCFFFLLVFCVFSFSQNKSGMVRSMRRVAASGAERGARVPRSVQCMPVMHATCLGKKKFLPNKKLINTVFWPNLLAGHFNVTRAKSLTQHRKNNQHHGRSVVAALLELKKEARQHGSGGRGHAKSAISAARVWSFWRTRQRALGPCPSQRTVGRLVRGVNILFRTRTSNEASSQEQLRDVCNFARFRCWG